MANSDRSNLIQNLDKIAYGAAGVLALIVLLVPVFSGGKLARLESEVQASQNELDSKPDDFIPKEIPRPREEIVEQWATVPGADLPAWSSERRPAFIQRVKRPEGVPIAWVKPPAVERLEYLRDADKLQTYVRVHGSLGELDPVDRGEFTAVKLFRREGEEGSYVELRGLDGAAALRAGAVAHDDFEVEAGKTYTYKLEVTIGVKAGAPEETEIAGPNPGPSNELALAQPVPYDYAINIINASGIDPAAKAGARFFGTIFYADFKDEIVQEGPMNFDQGHQFGPAGPRGRPLWAVREIEDNKLTVVDDRTRKTVVHLSTDRQRNRKEVVELPEPTVKAEEPAAGAVTEATAPEEGQPEPAAGEEQPKEDEPEPAPEPEKKDSGKKKGGGPIIKIK
jgi:hypothetical protein